MDLKNSTCVPCEVGAPTVSPEELDKYKKNVPAWRVKDSGKKIERDFGFGDFSEAVKFINKVADLATKEGHHPDILLHDFKNVRLTLWTHKIGGLHRNDFILASKIDSL